jgi:hypothetical protein
MAEQHLVQVARETEFFRTRRSSQPVPHLLLNHGARGEAAHLNFSVGECPGQGETLAELEGDQRFALFDKMKRRSGCQRIAKFGTALGAGLEFGQSKAKTADPPPI